MRILAIRGENLASLAARFEIDFNREPLAGAGLFAITGETGAGKSTILDALCVALYGAYPRVAGAAQEKAPDPSGVEISAQDPSALLRRGAGRGFAEVDFRGLDGCAYRARWEIFRARGRADGNLQAEQRRLIRIADGQAVATGKKQVLEQVQILTDLKFAQFCRTVLLAQGDFDAFLLANENERAELLEKVTGTEIYAELSRRTHAQTDERQKARRRLEERRADIGLLDDAARCALGEERAALVQRTQETQGRVAGLQETLELHARIEIERGKCEAAGNAYQAACAAWDESAGGRALLGELERVEPLRNLAGALQQAQGKEADAAKVCDDAAAAFASAQASAMAALKEESDARRVVAEAEAQFKILGPIWDRCAQLDTEVKDMATFHQNAICRMNEADGLAQRTTQRLVDLEADLTRIRSAKEDIERSLAVQVKRATLADRAADVDSLLAERRALLARRGQAAKALAKQQEDVESLAAKIEVKSQEVADGIAERNRLSDEAARRRAILVELNEDVARREDDALGNLLSVLANVSIVLDRFERAHKISCEAGAAQARARSEATVAEEALVARMSQYSLHKSARNEITALVDLADATISKTAVQLRASLIPGEPCPVCGSSVHPHVELDGAVVEFVAQIKTRRGELDAKLEQTARSIETAKGARAAALMQGAQAAHQIGEAAADLTASAQDYAELLPQLEHTCTAAGLICALPRVVSETAPDVFALAERAQASRAALAPALERARCLRDDIETFRRAHETVADAVERAASDLSNQRIASQTLIGQRTETGLLLQHLDERLRSSTGALCPYLEAADSNLAELEENHAAVAARIKLLGDSYRNLRAEHLRVDQELHEIEPQYAGAREAAELAKLALQRSADEAAEALSKVNERRDERALLLDGEATGSHRTRHNAFRQQAHTTLDTAREFAGETTKLRAVAEAACGVAATHAVATVQARSKAEERFAIATSQSGLAVGRVHELLAIAQDEREDLRREIELLRQSLADAETSFDQRKGDLRELLAAAPESIDAAMLRAEIAENQMAVDDLQRRIGAIDNQLGQDDAARASAATLSDEIAEASCELAVWQAVDEAIGSANGDKFRRFAQGVTLDHLVQLANSQLAALAPRYALARTNTSELGLSVIDRDMGAERRGTRSLSGGERFLVSLALAIALSGLEGRQSFVDTLFIDEGFGSLDTETLDIAIDALECLHGQGRKVGVITHVAAMIERIAVQVRVEKRGNGRSTIAITAPGMT
ncbi:MAG: AAA family ATPase [Beijerinckiaceae bacterium]